MLMFGGIKKIKNCLLGGISGLMEKSDKLLTGSKCDMFHGIKE
jgi:hypothetical protein